MRTSNTLVASIERIFEDIASSATRSGDYRDREWTRQIKLRLRDLGIAEGYDVGAASCDRTTHGEWLFDLTWSQGYGSRFCRLPLAMESEWSTSPSDILWDFGKLVVAKADLKLFVFQQHTDDDMRKMISDLREAIDAFEVKVANEQYLLAGYSIASGRFLFERIAPLRRDTSAQPA